MVPTSTMITRFRDLAVRAFSFLEGAGFRMTAIEPSRVKYESMDAFISISWDDRSGEIDVFFGLNSQNKDGWNAFSLTDLLDMENADTPERKMPFQISDETNLGPFLEKLAKDTQTYAQLALTGDRMFYRRLETFRTSKAQADMRHMQMRRARAEADTAWEKRDLSRLIELFTPIESELNASERAKLAYAKQHHDKKR